MTTPATREEVVAVLREALTAWMRARMTGRDDIGSILTALEQHGLALVPVEATEAMANAGCDEMRVWLAPENHTAEVYRAMLAASPYNKETGNG